MSTEAIVARPLAPSKTGLTRLLRIGRGLLWILSLLILALLVLYAAFLVRCRRLAPTGDALFDAYTRAVRDKWAWSLYYPIGADSGINHSALPDSTLAVWEPRFGQDPRYWQLRCWNAGSQNLPGLSSWDWPSDGEGAEFLEEARQRGVADSQTLQLLALIRNSKAKKLEFVGRTPAEVAQAAELRQTATGLLSEAGKADPTRAWPHYLLAMHYADAGADEPARSELQAGNAAPKLDRLALYPEQFVVQRLYAQQPTANPYICFGILQGCRGLSTDWSPGSNGLRALRAKAATTPDLALARELHLSYARMGQDPALTGEDAVQYATHIKLLARKILLEQGDKLSRRQRYMALWVASRSELMVGATNPERARAELRDSWRDIPLIQLGALAPPFAQVSMADAYMAAYPPSCWAQQTYLPSRFKYLELVDYMAADFGYSALRASKLPSGDKPPNDE